MGTAVLHAQDCLSPYQQSTGHQGFQGAVYHRRLKFSPQNEHGKKFQSQSPVNSQSRRKAGQSGSISPQKSKAKGPELQKRSSKNNEVSSEAGRRSLKNQTPNCKINRNNSKKEAGRAQPVAVPKNLVMGQVMILKRGQAVESSSHMMDRLGVSPPKADAALDRAPRSRYLGPSPTGFETEGCGNGTAKKYFSHGYPGVARYKEEWAGPAFTNSPAPSCLPVPMFSVKKTPQERDGQAEDLAESVSSATRDLRRLLRLD
uniref:TSA: Wollemia nobilis Ref_Wollemi_Transcript_7667_1586 transcribed RNA sequence n=1 Tax=Wollemia nobilis TaxID=56998 RepID=A0A0C9QV13_9CONI